jgi:transcriptional regulator with XRE-family HTH domain
MAHMSSTPSRLSQALLHLQRQASLYAIDMTIGKLIQKARKAKKWSLQRLADEIGVSKQLVWQWERDDTDPRKHIEALSRLLEVPVDYFYGPSPKPGPLAAKIGRLTPDQQELIERMVDSLLGHPEEISVKRS